MLEFAGKNITVGYLKPEKASFISNITVTDNFLNLLSHFVKVVTITTNLKNIDLRKLKMLNIDYLLVNIKDFGIMQFILREKNRINIPFIIILHTIYKWFMPLVNTIPLIRKEDVIIAPSEYAKNSFLKISGKLKVHFIPHCLDVLQIQKNIPCNFKKHRKEIGFMGRLVEKKGIETLIDCMPEIISRVGDAHLSIIGPLSGELIKDRPKSPFVRGLERKVRRLKLTGNVTFRGVRLGSNKYKILSNSDIFVYPTLAKGETFGLSTLEALACSLPVITTNLGGNRELIKEGENGYFVNVNCNKNGTTKIDRKQLVSLIVRILQDEKLTFKMKKKASEIALNYDFRKIMPRLITLLERKKYSKADVYNNRWELLKNKKIIDFKSLYKREILFFICFSSIAYKTYSAIYNEMRNDTKIGLSDMKASMKMNRNIDNTNKKLIIIKRELFRYLSIHETAIL